MKINMNELFLNGKQCIIARQIKRQKKTSKYKLINWFYKKIYGYEYESVLPPGADIIWMDNMYIFKNRETYEKVKQLIEEGKVNV